MKPRAQATWLDNGRLHLNDGPIDLIIFVDGDGPARRAACSAAVRRFATVLDELCAELAELRTPSSPTRAPPAGAVARRMAAATRPLSAQRFITPMAAVAGAVADEILAVMRSAAPLRRAYVNNGGDIAIHVSGEATLNVGLVDRPDMPTLFGVTALHASHGVGGVATSGWRGRSFSLGIADAATVLARDAAQADAAATLVANAVDLPGHRAILRVRATDIDPQSDLGDRLVTRSVGALSDADVACALERGEAEARRLIEAGAIVAACLRLQDARRVVGNLSPRRDQSSAPQPFELRPAPQSREDGAWRRTFASS